MEYCTGFDLFSFLELQQFKINEVTAINIIKQLASAISYLHERNVIHRDIKPENILAILKENLDTNEKQLEVKLFNFRISTILTDMKYFNESFSGTLVYLILINNKNYMAPEVLLNKPHGKEADIWGLGIISYLLLTGFLPFDDHSDDEIKRYTYLTYLNTL